VYHLRHTDPDGSGVAPARKRDAEQRKDAEQKQEAADAKQQPPRADEARGYEREPGTEPEDVALAVPRAVLAVPRFALKLVFFPVQATVQLLDRYAVIEEVEDVLYNDERTGGIVPKLSIDSYFGPSVGLKAFHEDLGGHDEYGSASALFGGIYNFAAQVFQLQGYGNVFVCFVCKL
jgi:hypothetical protein